jgi:hypothetical protein
MSTIQKAYWNALLADATYALDSSRGNVGLPVEITHD